MARSRGRPARRPEGGKGDGGPGGEGKGGGAMNSLLLGLLLALVGGANTPPPDVAAVLAEARALVTRGQPAAAIQKLLPLDRKDPRVAQLLGVAYYHTDDHVRAIELLTPAAGELPAGSPEAREAEQVLGLALYLAGKLPESIPHPQKTPVWAGGNNELLNAPGK